MLIGIAAGWIVGLYVLGAVFSSFATLVPPINQTSPATVTPPVNETSQMLATMGPIFRDFSVLYPIVIVIQLASIAVLTLGFRDLGKVDRARFSTPSTLMLVMIAGTFISAAGAIFLFNGFSNFFTAVPVMTGSPQSPNLLAQVGSIFLDLVIVGIGGVLTLIGFIGGQMLGLWRVGTRYDETLLKIAAIFLIIPLLNIVAPILVIVGAHGAKSRLSRAQQVI